MDGSSLAVCIAPSASLADCRTASLCVNFSSCGPERKSTVFTEKKANSTMADSNRESYFEFCGFCCNWKELIGLLSPKI